MRIVDVSAMVGPWALRKLEFDSAEALVRKMDHYGISEAYAYSSYAVRVSPIDGNYLLAGQIKGFEDRIKPVWVVLPTWDLETGTSLETELKKHDVRMVRMFPNDHGYLMDTWVCDDLYAMLQRNRIPVMVNHCDVSLSQLHAVSSQYPELNIIITQCEYSQDRNLYKLFEKHSNIYLEIATYYVYDGVEDIAKKFGAQRMIFGSRMPFQEGGAALGMALMADVSETEREMILSGNIDRLLKGGKL